jgi:hypothetical protein
VGTAVLSAEAEEEGETVSAPEEEALLTEELFAEALSVCAGSLHATQSSARRMMIEMNRFMVISFLYNASLQ